MELISAATSISASQEAVDTSFSSLLVELAHFPIEDLLFVKISVQS